LRHLNGHDLQTASTSRSSGEWNDDDYDVLTDGIVVGRIMKAVAAPDISQIDVTGDEE
jgi:hypothetical protein